jgi:hypothetical protein
MPSCSGGASRWISALAIAGARMNRTCCCRSGCPPMTQAALTPRHRRRPSRRSPSHRVLENRVHRPLSGSPEVTSGFRAEQKSSPPHALARYDEGGGARGFGAMDEKYVCRDDDNKERKHRDKVDLSGIVTMVADFPAHCLCPPGGSTESMPPRRRGSRHGSNACLARRRCGRIDSAQLMNQLDGALTPRHRPNRHGRYHRAPTGLVSGTLSIPDVPQG